MIRIVIVLMVAWVALWSDPAPANIAWGLILGGVLLLFGGRPVTGRALPNPVFAVRALTVVLWSLVTSSLQVVRASLFPTPERTATSVVEIRMKTRSQLVLTLVANSITLTPGTMTVECDVANGLLTVHVLGAIDVAEFNEQMIALEQLLLRAVGGRVSQ